MKNVKAILLLALVITSLGCAKNFSASSSKTGTRSAEIFDVFEALLRHQWDTTSEKAYFISIDGKDPSPEFLKRFDVSIPAARRLSEYTQGAGLKLNIVKWSWTSDDIVELELNSSKVVNASTIRYTMKRNDGVWIVNSQTGLFFACGQEPD